MVRRRVCRGEAGSPPTGACHPASRSVYRRGCHCGIARAARLGYRSLLRRKREEFWRTKIDAESSTPRQLWKSIDALMGRGSTPEPSTIGPTDFHQFFDAKVAGVRASTADAPSPTFTAVDPGCSFTHFELLTVEDVAAAIRALPDKQCSSDPIATRYVKEAVDVLAPFCTELFNRSLTAGSVPSSFKAAYVTPLLKKAGLDPADVSSYRPISNLSVMSKLLERLVAKQLVGYLTASGLLPRLQSAYRAHHSTETAVLKVMTDILRALDTGNLAVLTLLDLSAAFDTVDHATLLRRLSVTYGRDGAVLSWFRSYLSGRTQFVRCGSSKSASSTLSCGVPQGSVLGPILFLLYTADLLGIIEQHDLIPHLYADDTQICEATLHRRMSCSCRSGFRDAWMTLQNGCSLIVFNSTQPRRKCSGVHPFDVSIRFHSPVCVSASTSLFRLLPSETSEYIWTVTSA